MSAHRPRRMPIVLPNEDQIVLARAQREACAFCGGEIRWDSVSGAIFAASSPAQRRAFMEALETGAGPGWAAWWCPRPGCDGVGFSLPSFLVVW